jgi:glycosyltransferase involved in cell wall biosynthesis
MPEVHKESPQKIIRFGFVGNITPTKGFAVLLRELQLIKHWENIEVHIFGQVYDENYFKKEFSYVSSHYLNKIKFHGRFERDDQSLRKVYENMDILIFPSICEENSPLVVRESLMTGTPVIASNLGGIPEIIENEINGLLFDPDCAGDLAKKITGLMGNRHLLLHLCEGAKKTAVLPIHKHAEEIINLYSRLIQEVSLVLRSPG